MLGGSEGEVEAAQEEVPLRLAFRPATKRCSGDLLVGKGGDAADFVRAQSLVEVFELMRSQLLVGVVGSAGKVVCLNVCCTPDVMRPKLYDVGID